MSKCCNYNGLTFWDSLFLSASFFILALSISGNRERLVRIEKAIAPVSSAVELR